MQRIRINSSHFAYIGCKEEIAKLFFTTYEKELNVHMADFGHLDKLIFWKGTGITSKLVDNQYKYFNYFTKDYTEISERASINTLKNTLPNHYTHFITFSDPNHKQNSIKERFKLIVI